MLFSGHISRSRFLSSLGAAVLRWMLSNTVMLSRKKEKCLYLILLPTDRSQVELNLPHWLLIGNIELIEA